MTRVSRFEDHCVGCLGFESVCGSPTACQGGVLVAFFLFFCVQGSKGSTFLYPCFPVNASAICPKRMRAYVCWCPLGAPITQLPQEVQALLKKWPDCRRIELLDCRLTAHSCACLATDFQGDLNLDSLTLDYNPIGDEGVRILANSLASFGRCPNLSVAYCGLGPESGVYLADFLLSTDKLVTLNLQGNSLGPEGVIALAGVCFFSFHSFSFAPTSFCGMLSFSSFDERSL